MKKMSNMLPYSILLAMLLGFSACSSASVSDTSDGEITYIGCTPGDALIKSILGIDQDTYVDFIRWDLTFQEPDPGNASFSMDINFGASQPNTSGFTGGGIKKTIHGVYTHSDGDRTTINGQIYKLTSPELASTLMLVALDDNLLHLLTPEYDLMIGNGGWSYTLGRKEPISDRPVILRALTSIPDETTEQVIYDGRTPCQPFAGDYRLDVDASCFKLKWRLILNRDPKTMEPTTYQIQRTNIRETPITGKWTILEAGSSDSNNIIYQLDPDKPDASVYFLAGDENVLFLLDKERRLYVGDEDFSFTLNRKAPN